MQTITLTAPVTAQPGEFRKKYAAQIEAVRQLTCNMSEDVRVQLFEVVNTQEVEHPYDLPDYKALEDGTNYLLEKLPEVDATTVTAAISAYMPGRHPSDVLLDAWQADESPLAVIKRLLLRIDGLGDQGNDELMNVLLCMARRKDLTEDICRKCLRAILRHFDHCDLGEELLQGLGYLGSLRSGVLTAMYKKDNRILTDLFQQHDIATVLQNSGCDLEATVDLVKMHGMSKIIEHLHATVPEVLTETIQFDKIHNMLYNLMSRDDWQSLYSLCMKPLFDLDNRHQEQLHAVHRQLLMVCEEELIPMQTAFSDQIEMLDDNTTVTKVHPERVTGTKRPTRSLPSSNTRSAKRPVVGRSVEVSLFVQSTYKHMPITRSYGTHVFLNIRVLIDCRLD